MLSVAVSAVSLVTVAVVTVLLVNKAYDDEGKRLSEMRRVVDQINTVNASAVEIETKQNNVIKGVTSNVDTVQKVVNDMQQDYVRSSDLQQNVKSDSGQFRTINLNDRVILDATPKANTSGNLSFNTQNGTIIGFEDSELGKSLRIGTELSMIDMGTDAVVRTENANKRLIFMNGQKMSDAGLVLSKNMLGVGVEPKYSTLDVKGGIAIGSQSNSVIGIVDSGPATLLSYDNSNIYLNGNNTFPSVNVPSDFTVGNNAAQWMLRASSSNEFNIVPKGPKGWDHDKKVTLTNGGVSLQGGNSVHNPSKLPTVFGGTGNVIRGDTEVTGDVNLVGKISMTRGDPGPMIERVYNNAVTNDRYGVGQYPGGVMRMYAADAFGPAKLSLGFARTNGEFNDVLNVDRNGTQSKMFTAPDMFANNMNMKRGLYANDRNEYWSLYHNNDNTLVFKSSHYSVANPSEGTGVFNITKSGDVSVTGNASIEGTTSSKGDISSSTGNVGGIQMCVGPASSRNCINANDVTDLKNVLDTFRTGGTFALSSATTSLGTRATNLESRVTALETRLNRNGIV